MPRLTDGQLAAAREIDLLSFLSAKSPAELVRTGANEYRTATHSSLVITPRYWYWNKGGIGSPTALDYLVKVEGMGFIDAARELLATGLATEPLDIPVTSRQRSAATAAEQKHPPLSLPPRAKDNDNLAAYLKSRGIGQDIIERCIADGIIYEGRHQGASVCVFVGRDDKGAARFAAIRGISTDVKKDAAGSGKAYPFTLPASDPFNRTLSVFESPIDALSHMTLGEREGWEQGGWRLSLAGTSHIALEAFLGRHREIRRVVLHMDGDSAGIAGAARIRRRIERDGRFRHIHISVKPARGGKDYNEALLRREAPTIMQDEVTEKSVTLAVRIGKLTADAIKKALEKVMAQIGADAKHIQQAVTGSADGLKHGKQTVKQLAGHNAGLSSIELKDPDLRMLNRIMRKNGVDFAPAKDGKGRYTLFFKGRDADALTRAFKQYTQKVTQRAARPSIAKALAAAKTAAKTLADSRDKVKNAEKGAR
jgi:hypothetical protein